MLSTQTVRHSSLSQLRLSGIFCLSKLLFLFVFLFSPFSLLGPTHLIAIPHGESKEEPRLGFKHSTGVTYSFVGVILPQLCCLRFDLFSCLFNFKVREHKILRWPGPLFDNASAPRCLVLSLGPLVELSHTADNKVTSHEFRNRVFCLIATATDFKQP